MHSRGSRRWYTLGPIGPAKTLGQWLRRTLPILVVTGWLVGMAFPWIERTVPAGGLSCRVQSIHDGDTMRLDCAGKSIKVRLYCIDAAELDQDPWGRNAQKFLREITPRRVLLEPIDKDDYGRVVGEVRTADGGSSLNRRMVADGYAVVYSRHCHDPAYYLTERQARASGLGVWKEEGLHQTPWAWRWKERRR